MSEVNELEQQKSEFQALIARRDAANRLSSNRDFRKLIREDFMVTEAVRLLNASGEPNCTPEMRADMGEMARAGGHLKRFLSAVIAMGNAAANRMGELEDEITAARSEEQVAVDVIDAQFDPILDTVDDDDVDSRED